MVVTVGGAFPVCSAGGASTRGLVSLCGDVGFVNLLFFFLTPRVVAAMLLDLCLVGFVRVILWGLGGGFWPVKSCCCCCWFVRLRVQVWGICSSWLWKAFTERI